MSQLNDINQILRTIKKAKGNLESQIQGAQRRIQDLQEGIRHRTEQNDNYQQVIGDNHAWMDAARKEVQQLHADIKQAHADLLELQEQLENIEVE